MHLFHFYLTLLLAVLYNYCIIAMQGVIAMSFNFNWSAVSGGAPYITFSTLGIAFNSFSISRLGNPEKIIVGFDEEQCVIGIKAYANEPDIKPYEFSSRVRNGWIRIGCKDFIKYLQSLTGIDFSAAKRYVAMYDAKLSILMVHVKGESETGDSEDEVEQEMQNK